MNRMASALTDRRETTEPPCHLKRHQKTAWRIRLESLRDKARDAGVKAQSLHDEAKRLDEERWSRYRLLNPQPTWRPATPPPPKFPDDPTWRYAFPRPTYEPSIVTDPAPGQTQQSAKNDGTDPYAAIQIATKFVVAILWVLIAAVLVDALAQGAHAELITHPSPAPSPPTHRSNLVYPTTNARNLPPPRPPDVAHCVNSGMRPLHGSTVHVGVAADKEAEYDYTAVQYEKLSKAVSTGPQGVGFIYWSVQIFCKRHLRNRNPLSARRDPLFSITHPLEAQDTLRRVLCKERDTKPYKIPLPLCFSHSVSLLPFRFLLSPWRR
jgi:hypothetical protein